MNFFQHQAAARRKTWQLIVLFCLAVVSLITLTSLFVTSFLYFFQAHGGTSLQILSSAPSSWQEVLEQLLFSQELLWIAGGVCFVVAFGTASKHFEVRKGGAFIAETLGGRLLIDGESPSEKTLIHVVEEMAIASGHSAPSIYIIPDQSINAFVAGLQCNDAVLGVTEGCLQTLSRSQLQGVIAHEFSHIHHGDMRLNMRLLVLLHGIMAIGLVGEMLSRSTGTRGFIRHRRSKRNQAALLGLGLIGIGFCGTFFGNLIKSAITRQREFLADASAVQYTRNPQGIAGALKKIQAQSGSAYLNSGSAKQYNHFYFSEGHTSFLRGYFSSHPPLDMRISRIMSGRYSAERHAEDQRDVDIVSQLNSSNSAMLSQFASSAVNVENDLFTSVASGILHDYAQDPYTARALMYALLTQQEGHIQIEQKRYLKAELHPISFKEFQWVLPQLHALPESACFALIQISVRSLKCLSGKQRHGFMTRLKDLITIDGHIDVREWSIYTLLRASLEQRPVSENKKIDQCKHAIVTLIRFLSELNASGTRERAFHQSCRELWPENNAFSYTKKPSFSQVNRALSTLAQLNALEKPKLIKALVSCSNYDAQLSLNEQLSLKSIAASLNCPIALSPFNTH